MQTFYLQFKIRPKSFSVSQFSNTAGKLHLHKLKVAQISLETTIVFFSFLKSRMLSINLEAKALETKDLWENYIFPNLKKTINIQLLRMPVCGHLRGMFS